jgi:DNA-directed RNA polymerase alpha subunit
MQLFNIPSWLQQRPFFEGDVSIILKYSKKYDLKKFSDITLEILKEIYSRNRADFFYFIKLLGLYGIEFSGKLASYNGWHGHYKTLIKIPRAMFNKSLNEVLTNKVTIERLESFNIYKCKHIHGIPLENFEKLLSNGNMEANQLLADTTINIKEEFLSEKFWLIFLEQEKLPKTYLENEKSEDNFSESISNYQPKKEFASLLLEREVSDIGFPVRFQNVAKDRNIKLLLDLVTLSETELMKMENLGRNTITQVRKVLNDLGLSFNMKLDFQTKNNGYQINNECFDHITLKKLTTKIEEIKIPTRMYEYVNKQGYSQLWELVQMSEDNLRSIKNLGDNAINITKIVIENYALSFEMNFTLEQKEQISLYNKKQKTLGFSDDQLRFLSTNLKDIAISKRIISFANNQGFQKLWELLQISERSLKSIRNLGRKSIKELKDLVNEKGFRIGTLFSEYQINLVKSYKIEFSEEERKNWIKKTVSNLLQKPINFQNERNESIVNRRLWKIGKKETLEEIAQSYSITRERIRQLEKKVLNEIKNHFCMAEQKIVIKCLTDEVSKFGGILSFNNSSIQLSDLSEKEKVVADCILSFENDSINIDWDFEFVTTTNNKIVERLLDKIEEHVRRKENQGLFTETNLKNAIQIVTQNYGIKSINSNISIFKKFIADKKIIVSQQGLSFGMLSKSNKMTLLFKENFPHGLHIYKDERILFILLSEKDPELMKGASSRSITALLTNNPDIFLWDRGFCIHKDNVSYNSNVVKEVASWVVAQFNQGYSRIQVSRPFDENKDSLIDAGIPNSYALYTTLRLLNIERIWQRKYPTLADSEVTVDFKLGILEELEDYFEENSKPIPLEKIKNEFVHKRGWKEYSLQQHIGKSDVIFPWNEQTYTHINNLEINYEKLDELIKKIKKKLQGLQQTYSLKGAKSNMSVLWEQVCSNAPINAVIKLIRNTGTECLSINHYFVSLVTSSNNFISASTEIENYLLERNTELYSNELRVEFFEKRGWTDQQFYAAIRNSNLLKTASNAYVHPQTIGWNDEIADSVQDILKKYLISRNQNNFPHMQIDELINEFVLPELSNDIYWTKELLKSVGKEVDLFLFFDDAYTFSDNVYGIEDFDDMIGYLIAKYFNFGIGKKTEVEELLWREGILDSGKNIPMSLFFDGSSIMYNENTDEVELTVIGMEKYA